MSEKTNIDYEKKYNEALSRARSMYESQDDAELAAYIFPELRESEDERIRKALVWHIEHIPTVSEERRKEILSWLEKQKEPHYTKRNALFDKCVAECNQAVMKEVSDKVDEMLRKEQKSSVWESPIMTHEMIMEKQKEQKPAEWSEEDENMRNNILRVLQCFEGTVECESNPSLSTSYPLYMREIAWLKSLRPHWKPSEEQMEELCAASTPCATFDCDILNELYEQLKAL